MSARVPPSWRPARDDEALALMELERDANVAALGHIFPGPFPEDDILAQWTLAIADPGVCIDVVDGADCLRAVTAYDVASLRQLFVHPSAWGSGLGSAGVRRAVESIGPGATLWVLAENTRARRLYEHHGWLPTGVQHDSVWPPHPVQMELRWSGEDSPSR